MRAVFPAFGLLAMATSLTAADPARDDSGWKSIPLIEDGHIAEGWKHTGYGGFTVVDDALRSDGDPRGLGLLFYEKEKFGNCQIKVVYRSEDGKDNAGVYVRIDDGQLTAKEGPPAERNPDGSLTEAGQKAMEAASAGHLGPWYAVHHGYEVQICDGADPFHRTGAVYSLAKAEAGPEKAPGEWRTMVITLQGEKILVDLDGKRVSSFDAKSKSLPERKQWHEPEREPKRPEVGYIGLQNHDPGDTVYFKEVSTRRLATSR